MEAEGEFVRIFFGAGRIGRRLLVFSRECGLGVDYFVDNNPELWGKEIEGIPVVSISELKKISKDAEILVACKEEQGVVCQLLDMGFKSGQIKRCNSMIRMLGYLFKQPEWKLPLRLRDPLPERSGRKVIFDLSNGLVLGGVEAWSIQTAKYLEQLQYETCLMTNNAMIRNYQEENENKTVIVYSRDMSEWKKLDYLISFMTAGKYNNLICNFINPLFTAACLAKKLYPDSVRLIAVIHNDEDIYYQAYGEMQLLIDQCLVISKRIMKKLADTGFPKEKIRYLPWEIPCEKPFAHTYTLKGGCIHIGYAGRIVTVQKRLDYLIQIAEQLKEQGISFLLEIAGSGTYEEELKQEIEKRNLAFAVRFSGQIGRGQIMDFWKRQDIMISCSDYEGHSISQGEAMAAGAVPIITDVSGARDDVTDGENGFVVEVGAIGQIVKKICFLYHHRELLPVMGEKAYQTIKEKNNGAELEKLWKEVLLG